MSKRIKGVFVWDVHSGQEEEFIRRWKMDSDIIQTYSGALGTKLHKPADSSRRYLGYATWESLAHREKAMRQKALEHPELDSPENSTQSVSDFIFGGFFLESDIESNPPVIKPE